jgi:hypothetical protein
MPCPIHLQSEVEKLAVFYSGCQKNVPIVERFFCYNTYATIIFSEHYYDNWYNSILSGCILNILRNSDGFHKEHKIFLKAGT